MDKYDMDEIVNMAIMTKTPHIIVEGINDVCVYEAIADSIEANHEVYCIQMIEGYTGGNTDVAEAINYCHSLPMGAGRKVEDYVMGVIDRDSRYYRNEIPTIPALFILKYYSIESHFSSKTSIHPIIRKITRTSGDDQLDVDGIFGRIESKFRDLYYFSLDALKNATDHLYSSVVAFSDNPGRRSDQITIKALETRREDLDAFAAAKGLSDSLESIMVFSKGKWVLTVFSEYLFKEIADLVEKCKVNIIGQCKSCKFDPTSPCLFKIEPGFNNKTIYALLLKEVNIPEVDYIRDRLSRLSASASA